MLILDPLLKRADFVLEDISCCFFDFSCHVLFPLINFFALIASLDCCLKIKDFSVEGDELGKSFFEAIGEDIPI